ncbi:MAG: hypothetical protein DMG59_21220 [Acidobacteria bacterium]|nr:MAG: hypothetical protein DMG59_21220 [Acidobacteriota bacterium]
MSLSRALAVWFVLIGVEFIHGIVRSIFLVPVVGDFRARQIGVFIGSALILLVAYLFIGWLRAPDKRSLTRVGILWLVLTVAFEFVFGHFVFGWPWRDLVENYDVRHGRLLPFRMIVLASSPRITGTLIVTKLRISKPLKFILAVGF